MNIRNLISFFVISAFCATASVANAQVSISIKNEEVPKTKILFLGFHSTDPRLDANIAAITNQITKNLNTTNLFAINQQNNEVAIQQGTESPALDGASINGASSLLEERPDFTKYNKLGFESIVVANFSYDHSNNMEIKIRAWDSLDERQLFGKFYTVSKDNYRKAANMISDEIFKAITGEKSGHFDSKIIYIAEYGGSVSRKRRVSLMNFDGSERKFLTNGTTLVLTPIFSKKDGEVMFLNYINNKPQIYNLNIHNFRINKVGGFRGTTFAASAHPKDSNLLLISAITDGNCDIYEVNIAQNYARKLTSNSGIDTTPYYSPDGKKIVFSSDRKNGQQLYVMNSSDGGNIERITFKEGSYSKPAWSPDGKLIAFTKQIGQEFYIGTISASGKNEKLLTSGYMVEGVKWSPNGRYLLYSKKFGAYGKGSLPRLFVLDIVTGFERELPTAENEGATDPDWAMN